MAPPSYSDLGKAARDVFSKGYSKCSSFSFCVIQSLILFDMKMTNINIIMCHIHAHVPVYMYQSGNSVDQNEHMTHSPVGQIFIVAHALSHRK